MKMKIWIGMAAAIMLVQYSTAQSKKVDELLTFTGESSPSLIGRRVAERFLESPHFNYGHPGLPKAITYPEVCAWFGALTFARESQDKALMRKLEDRFEPLFGAEAFLIPSPVHVDNTVFGVVPFELAMQTRDQRYLEMGRRMADAQWTVPQDTKQRAEALAFHRRGLTWQTRLWIDDMYMITAVQAQAYRATGEEKYIDRAAAEMVVYLDSLQRPNGLFYHAPDVPFYWGRGNGWVAAGMTELLGSLPKENRHYARIMEGYQKMMTSLLKYQTPEGVWRQLVDDGASWPETSGTGMFAFAIITGVKNGWLDVKTFGPASQKAWLGLISYLDDNADLRDVCQGTNKKNNRQYYLDRRRVTGDLHGQAPILWCATALLRQDQTH